MQETKETTKIVSGNLITLKNPKYPHEHSCYLVLYGMIDQNGISYKVCSLGFMPKSKGSKLGMTIFDCDAKLVGKLSGDAFYEIKAEYYNQWFSSWENSNEAIYDAEPRRLL